MIVSERLQSALGNDVPGHSHTWSQLEMQKNMFFQTMFFMQEKIVFLLKKTVF